MTQKIQQTVNAAYSYIASQQHANGGFLSDQGKPTTFYTSLILSSVTDHANPSIKNICEKAAAFLMNEKTPDSRLNYWQKNSPEYANTPYPNDIDDTFVAMQALYKYDPSLVSEEVIADLISLLISQETAAGGPYRTWIIDSEETVWHDIDIVANANVACFLQQLGVEIPQLQECFDAALAGTLHSKYYHNDIPILYFLSRACKGNSMDLIVQRITDMRKPDGSWGNPLHTAFAVSALITLGSAVDLNDAIEYLIQHEANGSWSSTDLYIETIADGIPTYSSCSAYVSICCVQALLLFEKSSAPKAEDNIEETQFVQSVLASCTSIPTDPMLQSQLVAAISALAFKDPSNEIVLLSYKYSQQLVSNIPPSEKVHNLAVANVLGWIGYSIYDGILDGDDRICQLPLANTCIKAMINMFTSITDADEYSIVQKILEGIDSATLWEYTHSRSTNDTLPDYGDYTMLAGKSLGHAIGPILLTMHQPVQAKLIEQFFTHYLIAKQLNDDAHDWQEDLEHGWINSVSVSLIQAARTRDIDILQEYFWDTHIESVVKLILSHTHSAREILKKVTVLSDVTFLESLLVPHEQSARLALSERDKTRRLLEQLKY